MKFKRAQTGARPTAYTPTLVAALCEAYAEGASMADAAKAVGIGLSTVKDWLRESDQNPGGPKGDFRPMLEAALARSVVAAAKEKRKVDPGWWLARMRPKRFGDPARRIQVEGEVDVDVEVAPSSSFAAEVRRIMQLDEDEKKKGTTK